MGIYYFLVSRLMRGRSPAKGAVVIKAVLFDLDDTLLRLNLTAFIAPSKLFISIWLNWELSKLFSMSMNGKREEERFSIIGQSV